MPHQIPEGVPLFLTWNLKGAVPKDVAGRLRAEGERLSKQPPRRGETPRERRIREGKIAFLLADRYLDSASAGPLDLKAAAAAQIVEDSILFGATERYALYAWCVMANHVHALFTPHWELRKITQGLKGFTAHEINWLSGRRGRHLWQDESFDHWARDEEEMMQIIHYIEHNPVAAGLCRRPEEWRWSSARFRGVWRAGTIYVGQAFEPDKNREEASRG